jgi:hypothetical protein
VHPKFEMARTTTVQHILVRYLAKQRLFECLLRTKFFIPTEIVFMIKLKKSRKLGWARSTHGEKRNTYRVLMGNPEGKREYDELNGGWRIILRWNLKK